jgi:outer membrane protein assembly factor BamB
MLTSRKEKALSWFGYGWRSLLWSAVLSGSALAGEWPQFLGPDRNGISSETGLLKSWPADGPKEVWRAPGGVGMAGLAISGGRLCTVVQRAGQEVVICLDAKSGAQKWETPISAAYKNPQGDGTRATPAIAGEQVYVFTGAGKLAALTLKDGAVVWSHETVDELDGEISEFGMASSPLVVDNLVVVTVGAPGATLAAYECDTGKLAWKAGNDPAGYSSPALLKIKGQPQIVLFDGAAAMGLSIPDGKTLWRYDYKTDFNCNIATPIVSRDQVFLSAGENHGCVLLSFKPQGKQFAVEKVWASNGPKSVMRNGWQTSLPLDGYLYGYDNVGAAGPVMHLNCVEMATGKLAWQQLRFGKGNCIAADGKLFCSSMEGELIVVRVSPKAYDEIGRATVFGTDSRQAPALANGLLYLRDSREILCFDVRE